MIHNQLQIYDMQLRRANDELLLLRDPDFSFHHAVDQVQDWNAIGMRLRLNHAEAQLVPGQVNVVREVAEKGPLRVWYEMNGEDYGGQRW